MEPSAENGQSITAPKSGKDKSRVGPPRARFTLRVGVTGYLPERLPADPERLNAQIRKVLEFLADICIAAHKKAALHYQPELPILRLISPLAEGADRLVAQQALAVSEAAILKARKEGRQADYVFELHCPLPFFKDDYLKDFADESSCEEFRQLLYCARVLELDGIYPAPEDEAAKDIKNKAYEAVGKTVLTHSDVLIAIRNNQNPSDLGFSGRLVSEASRLGIPTIWISATPDHEIQWRVGSEARWNRWEQERAPLITRIEELVMPPAPKPRHPGGKPKPDLRKIYFSEKERKLNWGFLWKLFRDPIAEFKIRRPKFRLERFEQSVTEDWNSACLPEEVIAQLNELKTSYSWADKLADYYANVYRSAFVINYLAGALAVVLAFLSYIAFTRGAPDIVSYLAHFAEAVTLLLIVFFYLFGNKKNWHERWIDYRLLAEQLRHTRFLMTLGLASTLTPLPAYDSYGDPANSWMYWHLRAIAREVGMLGVHFDKAYLKQVCRFLKAEIDEQERYHNRNAEQLYRADRCLWYVGCALFALALLACLLHQAPYVAEELFHYDLPAIFDHGGPVHLALTIITVVAPSFGAALTAIRFQEEFERVSKRSAAMSARLQLMSAELAALIEADDDTRFTSEALSKIAANADRLMVQEVLNWRIVFQERPLELG